MKTLGTFVFVSGLIAFGCSSSTDGGENTAVGGSVGIGGLSSAGGSTGFSTASTVGGSTIAVSATTNPGTTVSGGASSTSSAPVIGGSGGTSSAGGSVAAGGKTTTSTKTSTGGVSSGGSTANGGTTSAGGTKSSGGTTSMGGSKALTGGTTSISSTTPPKVCDLASATTLKAAAACNNKLIGAAINQGKLSTSGYTTAASEFNFITPENEMKWDTVESSQNNFNYGPGDAIVNFANQKSAKLKGHTLVWHSQLPSWVSSASDVKATMVNHITQVMTHYKGKIFSWDVVNEAVDVDNKLTGMGNARLRSSVFLTKVGKDYIDLAFQTASKVDPNAKLFYNDYSSEGMNDKSNYVYEMVKSMKERGIPIHGVGIQMHIGTPNDSPTAAEIKENIDRIAALGLEIQISELDVNGCDGVTDAQMATIYHDIVAACVSQPLCTAITVWGINDGGSWLNSFSEAKCNGQSARALMFTDSYAKKGTYEAVRSALTGH